MCIQPLYGMAMQKTVLPTPLSQSETCTTNWARFDTLAAAAYGLLLLTGISVWLLAVHAPLWTDETLSYWQIAGGFKEIWSRSIQGNMFAAYAYILWLTKTIFGSKEIILRIPSILAMLAAAYVFYRCARELFSWDVSLIATVMFILPRGIAFAAIDVRPYAFALLTTNLAILMFLRWTKTQQARYAALLGAAAGAIFYFQYLFASVLGALVICYLVLRGSSWRKDARQIGIGLGCFVLVLLPVLPRLAYVYQTRTAHTFARAPHPEDALQVVNPGTWQLLILAGALLLAAFAQRLLAPDRESVRKLVVCLTLALFPVVCLYAISAATPIHVFIARYLLVSVPGVTLFWAWCLSLANSRALRVVFCLVFVASCVVPAYRTPNSRKHEDSWKASLAAADRESAEDGAPVLMCSPLIEADFQPMPASARDSALFAPLSYYNVNAAIVPLPFTMNDEAVRQVDRFLAQATPGRKRFLMLVPWPSVKILEYVANAARESYTPHVLGEYDDIGLVEFVPRPVGY